MRAFLAILLVGCFDPGTPWPDIPAAECARIDRCALDRELGRCLWESPTTRRWLMATGDNTWDRATAHYLRRRPRGGS